MGIQVVAFNCILKNKSGEVIKSTFKRDVLTQPADAGNVLTGLAKGLQNLIKGEKRSISVTAEEAYGQYMQNKIILFPRNKLPALTRVGETIEIVGKSGKARTYKVLEFHDNLVNLDGNHPLAGQDLIFEIEAHDAREATSDEITKSKNPISALVLHS